MNGSPNEPNKDRTQLCCWVDNSFLELLQFLADEFYGGNLNNLFEDALKELCKNHPEP